MIARWGQGARTQNNHLATTFAHDRAKHPPRLRQGYRIWLIVAMR
jgi:hypothetical protein